METKEETISLLGDDYKDFCEELSKWHKYKEFAKYYELYSSVPFEAFVSCAFDFCKTLKGGYYWEQVSLRKTKITHEISSLRIVDQRMMNCDGSCAMFILLEDGKKYLFIKNEYLTEKGLDRLNVEDTRFGKGFKMAKEEYNRLWFATDY